MRGVPIQPGEKFGLLTAVRFEPIGTCAAWLCRCACGNETVKHSSNLRSNHTRSCGCLKSRRTALNGVVSKTVGHGQTNTKLYYVWSAMIQRCSNTNDKAWPHYGARGITVHPAWLKFDAFFADMGPTYKPKLCIERRDNDGGYTPDNCYWATRAQQARNTSRVRMYTFNGKTQCLTDWATDLGLTLAALSYRLRVGMPLEKVFSKEAQWSNQFMKKE